MWGIVIIDGVQVFRYPGRMDPGEQTNGQGNKVTEVGMMVA